MSEEYTVVADAHLDVMQTIDFLIALLFGCDKVKYIVQNNSVRNKLSKHLLVHCFMGPFGQTT